jgi:predicted nucleic acid-binding protein
MHVLVSDTSILIDLERAGLEDVVFQGGHRWVVPDLLYATELEAWHGQDWLRRGLEVIELSPEETETAQRHFQAGRAVSLNDCFALSLALHRQWTLLTGDGSLRKLANENRVDCHGFLWLVELAQGSGADLVLIEQGIRRLLAHPRCRLPRLDTEALLRRLLES